MNDENTQLILNTLKLYQDKNEEHFKQIDKRFEHIDEHFAKIDKRLDQNDKHFVEIDKHFEQNDNTFKEIKDQLDLLGNTVARIEYFIGEKAQIGLEHASIAIDQHEEMKKDLVTINSKLDNHELRIEILEEKIC